MEIVKYYILEIKQKTRNQNLIKTCQNEQK